MEKVLRDFLQKFESDEDIINPFIMNLKMIIYSADIDSISQNSDLKQLFSILSDFLCCDNICIFDSSANMIFSANKLNDVLLSKIQKHINYCQGREIDIDFEVELKPKKTKRINLFSLDTLFNRYFVVFVDNDLQRGEETDELIISVKATLYIIISNIEKIQRIKDLSERDGLTWVKNRQTFQNDLSSIPTLDADITFVLLDLYQLRNINNNLGHLAGDEYIKTAAQLLNRHFPESVYRIGGDEFAIITTADCNIDETMVKVNSALTEAMRHIPEKVYLNYGYVKEHSGAISPEEFYHIADQNQSKNKREWYASLGIDRRRTANTQQG